MRFLSRSLVFAVAVVVAGGCTRNEPARGPSGEQRFSFTQAKLIPGGNQIDISTLPCHRDLLRTDVDETANTVTVTVTSTDYPEDAPDCGSTLPVRLEAPFIVGDRTLIDGSTGKEVPVSGLRR